MNKIGAGFIYTLETIRHGRVIQVERFKNLVPIQGLDYLLNAGFKQGTQYPNFYTGLYEGSYSPVPGDTMATFPAAATELVAYEGSTRQLLILGDVAGGAANNVDNRHEFVGTTAGKQAHGGFISSSPTKGSTTGILVSAVRFPSPRPLGVGEGLRLTAAFSIVSL